MWQEVQLWLLGSTLVHAEVQARKSSWRCMRLLAAREETEEATTEAADALAMLTGAASARATAHAVSPHLTA